MFVYTRPTNLVLCFLLGGFLKGVFAFSPTKPTLSAMERRIYNRQMNPPLGSSKPSVKNIDETCESLSKVEFLEFEKPPISLLNEAIGFNASAASTLLSDIAEMRENGASRESMDLFLDNLLSSGPDASLPFWTRFKRVGRFSRRGRMASLRRTLDMTTPPPSESENKPNESGALQRRRRALVALLRSLSAEPSNNTNLPAIVYLEKKAIQASKEDAESFRNRLPEGLETPDYDVVSSKPSGQKGYEIRRYKPYSVCAVSMNKPRPVESTKTDAKIQAPELSGASSFGALAGYLFGKNDKSTAMKMTTPVLTSPLADAEKQMEFVLPSQYWDSDNLTTAPKPLSGSGVTLQQKESEERAVLMFGGYASEKEVARRKYELEKALSKDAEWKALEEEVTVAQYNDPFTVPWRRLNEVSIRVVRK